MNLKLDFGWDAAEASVQRWGESRAGLVLAGLVQTLALAYVWGYMADVWHIARTASFSPEIPDDWQF